MDASKMLETLEGRTTFQNASEVQKAELAGLLLKDHVDPTGDNLRVFVEALGGADSSFVLELHNRLSDWIEA